MLAYVYIHVYICKSFPTCAEGTLVFLLTKDRTFTKCCMCLGLSRHSCLLIVWWWLLFVCVLPPFMFWCFVVASPVYILRAPPLCTHTSLTKREWCQSRKPSSTAQPHNQSARRHSLTMSAASSWQKSLKCIHIAWGLKRWQNIV